MKNKKNLFSLSVLLVLAIAAFFIARNEGWFSGNYSTLEKGLSDFTIKDTAAIDKMVITENSGKKAVLSKNETGTWEINGKFQARPDCILNLLEMAYRIKVRSTVSAGARDNVIKRIAAYYKKIEFFVNGQWQKTYLVGPAAADNIGTYMVLETAAEGRSAEPYVMEIPGWSGVLDARIFTNETEWRFTGVFSYNYRNITQVKVLNHEVPQESFILKIKGTQLMLCSADDKSAGAFDTVTARGYLMHYQKIHYEGLARLLKKSQVDSLLLQTPYYTVEVTDNKNVKNRIRIYHMPSNSGETDLEGNPLKWNPERAYAILQTGEAAVIQFGVFDKILRSLTSFKTPAAKGNNPQ